MQSEDIIFVCLALLLVLIGIIFHLYWNKSVSTYKKRITRRASDDKAREYEDNTLRSHEPLERKMKEAADIQEKIEELASTHNLWACFDAFLFAHPELKTEVLRLILTKHTFEEGCIYQLQNEDNDKKIVFVSDKTELLDHLYDLSQVNERKDEIQIITPKEPHMDNHM